MHFKLQQRVTRGSVAWACFAHLLDQPEQELPIAAMFVNGSGQNEQSL
jgi:hypothetical protein